MDAFTKLSPKTKNSSKTNIKTIPYQYFKVIPIAISTVISEVDSEEMFETFYGISETTKDLKEWQCSKKFLKESIEKFPWKKKSNHFLERIIGGITEGIDERFSSKTSWATSRAIFGLIFE